MAFDLKERAEAIIDRFKNLSVPYRRPMPEQPRKPGPSEAQLLHRAVHEWAKERPEEFSAELDKAIEAAGDSVERQRSNHAESNYWLGYQRAMRDVREALKQWTEPFTDRAEKNPLGGDNAT